MRGRTILAAGLVALVAGPLAAQGAAPDVALRPLARPGTETVAILAGDVALPPGPGLALDGVRPRARTVSAPARPVPRPEDVLPQPVSAFLRTAGTVDPIEARLSTRSPSPGTTDLPLLSDPATPETIAFLPPTPVRRPLLPPDIPQWERRAERGLAVSPETAALAAMMARARSATLVSADLAGVRPAVRPGTVAPAAIRADTPPGVRPRIRPYVEPPPPPLLDPEDPFLVGQEAAGQQRPQFSEFAVEAAYRPPERPASIAEAAAAAEREAAEVRASMVRGSVCGQIDIQGEVRGAVPGAGACGIDSAVEVRSVGGVRLSTPAVVDCQTATALRDWVVRRALPAVGNAGGGLAGLEVMGAYSCRGRNGVAGARLSEHSFGRAIDIGGFRLASGEVISVLRDWSGSHSGLLRTLHDSACGIFGTVLGPAANAAHRDHFHFDTARYRSGSYCR